MKTKIATFGITLGLMAGISFSGVFNFNADAQFAKPQRNNNPNGEQVERLQPVPLKPLEKTDPKAQLAAEWVSVENETAPPQQGASINEDAAAEVSFNVRTHEEVVVDAHQLKLQPSLLPKWQAMLARK